MELKEVFSEHLRELRKEHGLTQQQASDGASITRASWNTYENGYHIPDSVVLKKIADFFGVSTDYLLGMQDKPINNVLMERINTLLTTRNVRQKDLADAVGVMKNTVSYWVHGQRTPNSKQLVGIAKFFNVSIDYLLGLAEEPTTDKDLSFVCEYTGLNQNAILILRMLSMADKSKIHLLNRIIESEYNEVFSTESATSSFAELKEVLAKVNIPQTTAIISSLSLFLKQISNEEYVYVDSNDNIICDTHSDVNGYEKIRKSDLLHHYYKDSFLKRVEAFSEEYNKNT